MEGKKLQRKQTKSDTILSFVRCLRPKQWTKNILLFAALLFSITEVGVREIGYSFIGFILFTIASGMVYIVNDYVDVEQDRLHPVKKNRPMAAGDIQPLTALVWGTGLFTVCLIIALYIHIPFALLLVLYFVVNLLYSFHLKHVVIIDVMIIASGFVIRAIAGAVIIDRPFTPWFLVCVMLLALFLAISKRRHEVMLLQDEQASHRKVLQYYSPQLLDQLISVVTTATIMSYALFTFTSGNTVHLMWTIPFLIYGIFRYLYLIYMEDKGGSPEKDLLQDWHIMITVLLYSLTVVIILNWGT